MKRPMLLACAILLGMMLVACDDGNGGGGVSNAEFKQACDNGVLLCENDPTHGQTFGAQDCSPGAIDAAYASCDSNCRAGSRPFIDCQIAATSCDGFADCITF